jgi:hypothetical protein
MNKMYWIAGVCTFLAACSTVQPTTFERLSAADVSFPENVRRIAVANNVPAWTPESQSGAITTWMEGDGAVAAESLAEEIASTNYFEAVVLADSALNTRGATTLEDTQLTREQAGRCIDDLQADLLVTLDRVILHARPTAFFEESLPFPLEGVEAVITPVLRVYLPGREGPMFTVAASDSLTWNVTPQLTDSLIRQESSVYAGGIPLHHLLPHWQQISRHYYDGGQVEMRDAGVSVRENQWDEAATLWRQVYGKKKGRTRRLAAFNMALYHEMRDEIPAAMQWMDRALDGAKEGTPERQQAEEYRIQLTERAQELGKLNAQMQRFDEKN